METATDFDLQELEARLYSQVFHSTENWEEPSAAEILNSLGTQSRHVSIFAINNVPVTNDRYWITNKEYYHNANLLNNQNDINNQANIIKQINFNENCSVHQNSDVNSELKSIISLEDSVVKEFRSKPLRYKSHVIPTTFKLPKSKVKKLPDNVITYFNLRTKDSKRKFRIFLRCIERSQKSDNRESRENVLVNQSSTNIITNNSFEKALSSPDVPIIHPPAETNNVFKEIEYGDIISISDSDNDSVIEVPLFSTPVYSLNISSESEAENVDIACNKICSVKSDSGVNISNDVNESQQVNLCEQTLTVKDKIGENTEVKASEKEIQNQSNNSSCEKRSSSSNQMNVNQLFTEVEKERDDLLRTPDSNTNDFLEHDVSLNKNNFCFNFGLHSSDLDISKDKESTCKTVIEHDLYETESSCSEIGSVNLKSRSVFNEINFESPMKDIFCEPDLNKFSNFITPKRSTHCQPVQNKVRSNKMFTQITTNVIESKSHRIRTCSDSSECHSDVTTLKIKKKSKKPKKKVKKKEKTKNEQIVENTKKSKININQSLTSVQNTEYDAKYNLNTDEKVKNSMKMNYMFTSLDSDKDHRNPDKFEQNKTENFTQPFDSVSLDYYINNNKIEELDNKQTEQIGPINKHKNISSCDKKKNQIERIEEINEKCVKEIPTISSSVANFSFIDTWRKSSEKCSNNVKEDEAYNDVSFPKKIKVNDSPIISSYIVNVLSSEEENNLVTEVSTEDRKDVIVDDISSSDILIVNVKSNKNENKSLLKENMNSFSFVNAFYRNNEMKTFKDFWTNDMTKFYDESWGQESFDLDKVLSSMPDDSSKWKLHSNDLIQYSRRRREPVCRINNPIKCSICGYAGHSYTRCPNGFCTTCRKPSNHLTISCGNCTYYKNIKCSICYNIGHEMKNCPDLWRRYHLTTESDTKLVTSAAGLKEPNNQWCSNCAKQGHNDINCCSLPCNHFPTTMEIVNYMPIYDKTFKLPVALPSKNIPHFQHTKVTIVDLRNMKSKIIQSTRKKYINILKQLKQQCNKYDVQLINQINRLEKDIKNCDFDKKKIQELYKIRAKVAKHKIP